MHVTNVLTTLSWCGCSSTEIACWRLGSAAFPLIGELRHPGSRPNDAVTDAVRVYIGLTFRGSALTATPPLGAALAASAAAGTKNATEGGRFLGAACSSCLPAL